MPHNSWSSQVLVSEECRKGEEVHTENALIVCNQNRDMFEQEFVYGKFKDQNQLTMPFSFIVLAGTPCPRGKFYEVEYTLGSEYGVVHRALIQAVTPEEDLPFILGALKHNGALPEKDDIVTHKAYLRHDIDAVRIVGCYHDEETHDTYIGGSHVTPREEEYSVLDTVIGRDPSAPFMVKGAVCLELYAADHCREVWISPDDKFETQPVFVSGGSNVFDPAFAEQREKDLSEVLDSIVHAVELLNDYGLQYIIAYQDGKRHPETGHKTVNLMNCCNSEFIHALDAYVTEQLNNNAAK